MQNLYTIPLQTLAGESAQLEKYTGKVLLIVNVASKCGFTPQYAALESLYQSQKERGLMVLGFPANDFGQQEPGTDAEIAQFCSLDYPVSFPLFSKISVTGTAKHPLYAALTEAQPTRIATSDELHTHLSEFAADNGFPPPNELPEVLWNFEKFLVDRNGTVVGRFNSDITPDSPLLLQAIEDALH